MVQHMDDTLAVSMCSRDRELLVGKKSIHSKVEVSSQIDHDTVYNQIRQPEIIKREGADFFEIWEIFVGMAVRNDPWSTDVPHVRIRSEQLKRSYGEWVFRRFSRIAVFVTGGITVFSFVGFSLMV